MLNKLILIFLMIFLCANVANAGLIYDFYCHSKVCDKSTIINSSGVTDNTFTLHREEGRQFHLNCDTNKGYPREVKVKIDAEDGASARCYRLEHIALKHWAYLHCYSASLEDALATVTFTYKCY